MVINYVVTSDQSGIIVPLYRGGRPFGSKFFTLTKQSMADLLATKTKIIEESRKDKDRTFYIDVDAEGECSIATTFTKDQSLTAYKNGSEIALPEPSTTVEPTTTGSGKKSRSENALGKVAVETVAKVNKLSKNQTAAGAVKPKKKMEIKTKAKKSAPKKAVKKAAPKKAAKKATGKLPEGKKMTITVKKAIELAKKGASIYRASNGSPFGELYLTKIANKDREMELIVRN